MAKKQISKSGAAKLREELDYLVTVRRAEMAQKLKEARAQGDLSENAEYDEAKKRTGDHGSTDHGDPVHTGQL